MAARMSVSVRYLQGRLLLLVTGLMRGGSLRAALQRQDRRPALQWYAR